MRIRSPKDFWAGLFFIAAALGFVLLSRQYSMGNMHRMGPALFPTLVGALLAGLGNDHELALHLRATANTGASEADVMEVMLHVAIYAGVPRANHAIKIARETFAAMRQDTK